MIESDNFGMVFVLGILTLLAVIIIVVVWQGLATYRARATVAREEAYRKLAEQVTGALQKTSDQQQQIAAELGDLRGHVATIEKILREVE